MSNLARSAFSIANAIPVPTVSDKMRGVAARGPDFWWSARERPIDARETTAGTTVRDRVRGIKFTGAFGDGEVGSPARPAIRFNGSVYQIGAYQLPATYTIFVLGRVNAYVPSTGGILFAHRTNSGNRMYLSVSPAGRLELAHTGEAITSDTLTGTSSAFCGWASYDHSVNAAAVSCNTAGVETTGTFTNDHSGQSQMAVGAYETGGVGAAMFNGWIEEIIVFAAPMATLGYAYQREVVMAALADQGGITLT